MQYSANTSQDEVKMVRSHIIAYINSLPTVVVYNFKRQLNHNRLLSTYRRVLVCERATTWLTANLFHDIEGAWYKTKDIKGVRLPWHKDTHTNIG